MLAGNAAPKYNVVLALEKHASHHGDHGDFTMVPCHGDHGNVTMVPWQRC